jgi:hypothetical protein
MQIISPGDIHVSLRMLEWRDASNHRAVCSICPSNFADAGASLAVPRHARFDRTRYVIIQVEPGGKVSATGAVSCSLPWSQSKPSKRSGCTPSQTPKKPWRAPFGHQIDQQTVASACWYFAGYIRDFRFSRNGYYLFSPPTQTLT